MYRQEHQPRIVIAGVNSGSGKTTITSGLMRLLKNKGLQVQGFKSGPDYIDPSYHSIATGRLSRNLDSWMIGEELVKELLIKNGSDADISVIEGVMGLFDGKSGTDEFGSTSHLAKITNSPVILVLDTRSIARSAAAIVYGFMHYDPALRVQGVILNKVASERHLRILEEAISPLGIPIIGHVMRNEALKMPERHLGLVPAAEMEGLDSHLDFISRELEKTLDYEKIIEIAGTAGPVPSPREIVFSTESRDQYKKNQLRIGYAWDKAFSFYYHDGLDYLRHLGVELVPTSPISDTCLPEGISGMIIGGGFPELYLEELATNQSYMQDLNKKHRDGMPIFAECGGFMYLNRVITGFENQQTPMLSLIPGTIEMTRKLVAMGYRKAQLLDDCLIGKKGGMVTGHEFHYSFFTIPEEEAAFALTYQENGKQDGYASKNLFASYLHFHFASNRDAAHNLLDHCAIYQNHLKNRPKGDSPQMGENENRPFGDCPLLGERAFFPAKEGDKS